MVTIVGGGLVGSLLAVYLARRGFEIICFEKHADLRRADLPPGRSINLTLAKRGLDALEGVGLLSRVKAAGAPVHGRILHRPDHSTERHPYGPNGECLISVRRNELNSILLDAVSREPSVQLRFDQRCVGVDLSNMELTFRDRQTNVQSKVSADIIIAADGAYSDVRLALQKQIGFNLEQKYSLYANKEITVRDDGRASWTSEREYLHIWPRKNAMLLAIPNRDGSFATILQLAREGSISHAAFRDSDEIAAFCREQFPDAVHALSDLTRDFFNNPIIPMMTIRCSPWSDRGRVLLIGDAAHAVWPSYGQGANAGFEDCAILCSILDACGNDWDEALHRFELQRKPDADAIADLSEQHMLHLRDALADAELPRRLRIEQKLMQLYPGEFAPLYTLVAFTPTPYSECIKRAEKHAPLYDALCTDARIGDKMDAPQTVAAIEDIVRTFRSTSRTKR